MQVLRRTSSARSDTSGHENTRSKRMHTENGVDMQRLKVRGGRDLGHSSQSPAAEAADGAAGAQSDSPDPDGLQPRAASGSLMLSGRQWQRLASSDLPGGSAASSGGGGESDAAATQPAGDTRRRSRKAVAPRR